MSVPTHMRVPAFNSIMHRRGLELLSEWKKGYGVVLDSGTTFTYIPTQPFKLILGALKVAAAASQLPSVPGPDPKPLETDQST
eukprot:scaffold154008_cov37-Prasinocladus_malaysianus.AAC.1